ncbi:Lsr2 family DNA-binding protein [Rhodococcus koreensis]
MAQAPKGSKGSAKTTREIREWAIGAGLDVSSRGRIPAEIVEAFEGAQAKKVQAKKVQAKNVQAKNSATGKVAVTKAASEKVAAKKAPAARTTKEIREWAIGAGLDVSPRGRIPAEIAEAFEGAQAKKVQAKTAPAKKLAARKPAVKKVDTEKPAAKKAPAAKTTKEIREWAIGAGLDVSSRGRISAEIVEAFEGAQAKKVQAKKVQPKKVQATTVPAKKVAAGKQAAEKAAAQKSVVKTAAVKKVDTEKPVVRKAPAAKTTKEIREWAIGAGLDVSSRGRISAEVERAFHDAQVPKVQAKTVRAKKVAAGKPAVTKVAEKKVAEKKVAEKKAAAKKTATRKTATRKAPSNRAAVSKAPAKRTTKEIREWAIGEGLDISARGRISAEIVDAFHLAQAKAPAA